MFNLSLIHILKTNAIKLLLLLHFYHPDRFGIIKNIDIRELAEHLHCDIKTVKNNLEILNRYAYVKMCIRDSFCSVRQGNL